MYKEQAKIQKGTLTQIAVTKWPWELEILRAMYGPESVVVYGDPVAVDDPPTAEREAARLDKVYGRDPETGIPWVVSVFGRGAAQLRQFMRDSALQYESEDGSKPARTEDDGSTRLTVAQIKAGLEWFDRTTNSTKRADLLAELDVAIEDYLAEHEVPVDAETPNRDDKMAAIRKHSAELQAVTTADDE